MGSRAIASLWKNWVSRTASIVGQLISEARRRCDAWFNLVGVSFFKRKSVSGLVQELRGHLNFLRLLKRELVSKHSVEQVYELAHYGHQFLDEGDVDNALPILRKCQQIFPESVEHAEFLCSSVLPALAVTELQGFGRYDAAQTIFREIKVRTDAFARARNLPLDNNLYLANFWTAHIGHLAAVGAFVKRSIMEGNLLEGLTLVRLPGHHPVNECLYSHWKKYGIEKLVTDLPVSADDLRHIEKKIFIFEYPNSLPRFYWEAMADVHRDWSALGLPSLLTLSEAEIADGEKTLSRLGVPRDAWFVCLHVRASGFKGRHESLHAPLNADIETYLPMMREITARGGWVIRMGDPSMPKLKPMASVVDYAHSPRKSDRMDVFLSAQCHFYVGTSSGLGFVPPLFGTPCVFTNWFPVGTRPFQPNDLYIFKLHWSERENELIPFPETLSPPLGHIHSLGTLRNMGFSLKDNTAEEITEVTLEMYERVMEGKEGYSESDNRLQSRFDAVAKTNRCYGSARLGRAFLRNYADLLPPSDIADAH